MRTLVLELNTSLIMTAILTVVLCGLYPLAVFVTVQGFFPANADGSLVYRHGEIAGSSLLAQAFTGPQYFHPRPSAAGDGYDATASGGSNLGPTSRTLIETVQERVKQYRAENNLPDAVLIPADAVTASGSGLDPHISVRNALLQAPRVANARCWDENAVKGKINVYTEGRQLGVLGEPRVNVLLVNIALDSDGSKANDSRAANRDKR